MTCTHTCEFHRPVPECPPEPPVGTWMKDRFGAAHQRRIDCDGNDGWGEPGFYSFGKWTLMWEARGPLVECGPWGADLPVDTPA
jgi:hypothetical protein